jgi:hypothetical protein
MIILPPMDYRQPIAEVREEIRSKNAPEMSLQEAGVFLRANDGSAELIGRVVAIASDPLDKSRTLAGIMLCEAAR